MTVVLVDRSVNPGGQGGSSWTAKRRAGVLTIGRLRACLITRGVWLASAGPSGARTQGGRIARRYSADGGRRTAPCPPPPRRVRGVMRQALRPCEGFQMVSAVARRGSS